MEARPPLPAHHPEGHRPTRGGAARNKVVLYNPRSAFFTMPLGLVAIGSHLDRTRYEVVIVDARLEKDPVAALLAHLPDALCLGVTVLTGAPVHDAIRASRAAKAARPDLPVVWGGWHPSLFGIECLEEASVDATVQAQGEETFALCRRSGLRQVIVGVESGSLEMMDRIRKYIRREQVFRSAEKCLRHGIAVTFPFIVCFPGETDASIRASLDTARELRAMSPRFDTPIFYFRPYPGTPLTDEAEAGGFRLPRNLEEWAAFDFHRATPWVTPERRALVENYRFYQRLGYAAPRPFLGPVQTLARWRCENLSFGFPVERAVGDLLFPPQALS